MKYANLAKQRYLDMLETACGPTIMGYFNDPSIIEIMLNPNGELFIERLTQGKVKTGIIVPLSQSENIIKLVASYKNQVIHEKSPMIATDIPFLGARFQGWIPPVVTQPTFSIRKRATQIFGLDHYVNKKILSAEQAIFLKEAVLNHKNIIIAGGTSSGKTTFTNALLDILSGTQERILVLEDLPELQVLAEDIVTLNTSETVSMRDLVKGSLRMRPDRIIVGEVRDGAALELLKAWNTGHPGGICTLHANSVESTPYRLEDLIREISISIPHYLITEAIDIVVFIERLKDGTRRVKDIGSLKTEHSGQYEFTKIL
ncbi:MAG: P-type conjugative transfer ATPase TrbB [Gammaproteobacteria bacterium]|nr:P-type conjugative transfer ATPase TrbB [Gammaproteobacteria bacterium]